MGCHPAPSPSVCHSHRSPQPCSHTCPTTSPPVRLHPVHTHPSVRHKPDLVCPSVCLLYVCMYVPSKYAPPPCLLDGGFAGRVGRRDAWLLGGHRRTAWGIGVACIVRAAPRRQFKIDSCNGMRRRPRWPGRLDPTDRRVEYEEEGGAASGSPGSGQETYTARPAHPHSKSIPDAGRLIGHGSRCRGNATAPAVLQAQHLSTHACGPSAGDFFSSLFYFATRLDIALTILGCICKLVFGCLQVRAHCV